MKFCTSLFFLCFFSVYTFAQNPLPGLLERLKTSQPDTSRVMLYKELIGYYRYTQPDSANYYATTGLALANKIKYTYGIAMLNGIISDYNVRRGKMELAKKQTLYSLHLFEKLKNQNGIAATNNSLGILAATQGFDKEATQYFLKALKIRQATNDTRGIIESYIKLAKIEEQNNNIDKSLSYLLKGAALGSKLTPSATMSTVLNNTGSMYAKKGDMKNALLYFKKALKISEDYRSSGVYVLALTNIGNVYQQQGDFKTALEYQNKALKAVRERHIPEQEAEVLMNIASLLGKNKPDSTVLLLNQALAITKQINHQHLMLEVYQGIVDINKTIGNYKKAEEALESKTALKDSLFTLTKSKEIAGLQANFDLVNETVKVQQLELQNEKTEFSRKIIIGISGGITFLLILFIFFYSQTRKLNTDLVIQKEELNKLNSFKDKLFSIIGHDLRSPVSNIVNMIAVFEKGIITADDVHKLIPQLKEQSEVTLEVLDKLLTWGKLHLKGVNLNKSVFNAKTLVQRNFHLYRSAAKEKSISLVDETPDDLPIFADISHVDFIIRNLLANAVKYTHPGGKIEVLSALNKPEGYNTIIIKDNGVGIARDLLQTVFDAKNISLAGTSNELGNSIGLMLCKEFMKENGGVIELKSELGAGTQFCISFPLV